MPIMRPEHQKAMLNAQKALADAGVEGSRQVSQEEEQDPNSLKSILTRKGIGLEDLIEELAIKVKSGNEGLSSRAIDTALKLHGVLKESAQGPSAPSFILVIGQGQENGQGQIPLNSNPNIPAGVNPIFVPRQILSGSGLSNQSNSDLQKTTN